MVQAKEKAHKHLIFSNLNSGSNCDEDCPKRRECDCDQISIEDERINLNKTVDGRILILADLGLWNGRRTGYKILSNNIRDILYFEADYAEFFGDGHNIKSNQHHHDGVNRLEYRVIREDKNIEVLLRKLYNQEPVSRQTINSYTKSLFPYVAQVYGWGRSRN